MSRRRRSGATTTRHRPPDTVVRVAMAAVALPVGALAWMVAAVITPWLAPAAVLVAAAATAAWGARVGVLAGGRRGGVVRRGVARVARLLLLAAVAVLVRLATPGTTVGDAIGVRSLAPGALLLLGFLIGRAVGRIHRRQADPLAVPAAHRGADLALMAAVLIGMVATTAVAVVAWTTDAPWRPARWTLVAWFATAVTGVVLGRPAVLRARTRTSPSASGGWLGAALPLLAVVVAATVCVAALLSTGLELRLRDALPALPTWRLDLSGQAGDTGPPPRRSWDGSTAAVGWQIVLLVTIVLALTWGRFARRRRTAQPSGPGLSLRMWLRSLLGLGRSSTVVDDGGAEEPVDPPDAAGVPLAVRTPAWVQRIRPRPRDPAAAILHDYRLVQLRLPEARRRRSSETVLAHAARQHTDALAELARMVCAIRFAERAPTAADAERSRLLARRLRPN